MALSRKRKVDSENRAFNPEWTDSFLFILPTGSTKPKSEILAQDVLTQLDEAMHKASCVGLAVDKSTDMCDNAKLLVYVRFFNNDQKAFWVDLLGVTSLQTSTREDINLDIKMLSKRGIEPKQVVSITTDGAPAMIGREKKAVERLKEDNPELIAYHCIIHQSVLCASLSDDHAEVMNTMMKMINFLRASSSYQHRMLREFLREADANADDLLLHNNGKDNSICELMTAVRSFQKKLEVFKEDLQGDCAHFQAVQEQVQGQRDVSSFVDFIDKLTVNFINRFDSFSFGQQLTMFFQNRFSSQMSGGSQKKSHSTLNG
ncbi:SCAN domain-containing protein 3-like [Tachysurus ichikawai]